MDKKHKNVNSEKHDIRETNEPLYRVSDDDEIVDDMRHGGSSGYGMRPVKKKQKMTKKRENIIRLYPEITEADKHRKIEKERKESRTKKQRFNMVITVVLVAVLVVALFFMTPIFNIREIRLSGNDTVSKEIINTQIGDFIGMNLFGTRVSDIEQRMSQIPQIGEVEVKKAVFPSRLELYITESRPAGYVLFGNTTLIIDSDLRIIDDASVFDREKLPSISGVSISEYEMNKVLKIKSNEKKAVLSELLKAFETTGMTNLVKYVSIDDLTAIAFNYDNRLDVLCGSRLQIDRKIRMFAESLKTSEFDDNSIGTIDLSVPGIAEYNP